TVPELTVRSCYVAAGRLMANDVPAYLTRKLLRAKQDPSAAHADIPGIGVDLMLHPHLGETELPADHFQGGGLRTEMIRTHHPFLAFTHVSGRSLFLTVPWTMRRIHRVDGTTGYRPLHLFRQEVYLRRLLRAAHALMFSPPL